MECLGTVFQLAPGLLELLQMRVLDRYVWHILAHLGPPQPMAFELLNHVESFIEEFNPLVLNHLFEIQALQHSLGNCPLMVDGRADLCHNKFETPRTSARDQQMFSFLTTALSSTLANSGICGP